MHLLYFLGCLPGGVSEERLSKMWDSDVSDSVKRIKALSFLEHDVDRLDNLI